MAPDSSPKLTWVQVADILKKRLGSGEYQSGEMLPSYRAIAAELEVSLSVCQRAMGQLRREGLVRISQGRNGRLGDPRALEDDFSFFGMIHPYNPEGDFGRILNAQATEAFASMSPISFPLIASSLGDSGDELKCAGQMCHNRVRGILLSPATGSGNADYFRELSEKMPVVLFDQELPGSGLPVVKFDYAAAGRELGVALKRARRKRVLLLFQEYPNRSLQEFADALREVLPAETCELEIFNRSSEATRRHDPQPILDLIAQIRHAVETSGCDALFCPYDMQMDMLVVNGLPDAMLDRLQLATLHAGDNRLPSCRYLQRDVWQWHMSLVSLIGTAAHRLVRWTINHHAPAALKKIPMERLR